MWSVGWIVAGTHIDPIIVSNVIVRFTSRCNLVVFLVHPLL